MTRLRIYASALAIFLLLSAAPANGAESTLTSLDKPTPIRTFGGTAVLSVHDRAATNFRLAISRGGRAPELLPVAPSPIAFDADVGPGPDGLARIVYSRCQVVHLRRRACDLYEYDLGRSRERRLSGTSAPGMSEHHPTIWRDRIAFVRERDVRPGPRPTVLVRSLSAPRSAKSHQMPGIPTKRCGKDTLSGRCEATSGRIAELELWGRWLALIPVYEFQSAGGVCGRWEIRLDSVADRSARMLGDTICGLSGQGFVGLSFASGRLAAYHTRVADAGGQCPSRFGAFRFALSTARIEFACSDRRIEGFSLLPTGRAYEVRAPDTSDGYCGNSLPDTFPQCQVVRTDPLRFQPFRGPL